MNKSILKFALILVLFLANQNSFAQITLNQKTLNTSVANQALILEDATHDISIEDLLFENNYVFKAINKPYAKTKFTTSRWIVYFEVTNPDNARNIVLETARPITDRADLYEFKGDKVIQKWKNGDAIPFNEKAVKHRKSLYHIYFKEKETKTFYLILESDGVLINLPLLFWDQETFTYKEYQNNLFHGFYFGVLAIVVFIFFFFYLVLKEISFLYYIIYVFFQFSLQFSLEGLTHQYIFPNSNYLTSISIVLSAALALIFALFYISKFLSSKERSRGWHRYLKFLIVVLGLIIIMCLIPGQMHAVSYQVVNLASLIATLSIITFIIWLKIKGYKVNTAFFLGFVILIIGALIFILGNIGLIENNTVSELALKVSSGLEVLALSISMAQRYKELNAEKENAQKLAFENLETEISERTKEVHEKREQLELQNKNMLDSIKYALRIQNALLPTENHIKDVIPDSFIIYKPKNIVSGDFYFIENVTSKSGDNFSLFAAVDCTGHGVPGAFMSFLANNYLNQSLKRDEINTTGEALNFLNEGIFKSLKIKENNECGVSIRDGMDLTLCGLNHTKNILYFSGAKNPIQILTKKKNFIHWEGLNNHIKIMEIQEVEDYILIEVKGNRQAIGYGESFEKVSFLTLELPIFTDDIIYSYTDGFPDQFGGPRNKKFGSKRFKKLLLSIHHLNMDEQKEKLDAAFEEWKGDEENLDDVLVVGVRV